MEERLLTGVILMQERVWGGELGFGEERLLAGVILMALRGLSVCILLKRCSSISVLRLLHAEVYSLEINAPDRHSRCHFL